MTGTSIVPPKIQNLHTQLSKYKAEFAKLLPERIGPERLLRFWLTATSKNPSLGDCEATSIVIALMNSAALGIMPDGRYGHLVPFGPECQFIIDYKGIAKLVLQSSQVASFKARAVRKKDVFPSPP